MRKKGNGNYKPRNDLSTKQRKHNRRIAEAARRAEVTEKRRLLREEADEKAQLSLALNAGSEIKRNTPAEKLPTNRAAQLKLAISWKSSPQNFQHAG